MTRSHTYPSPQAFRQALTDKLRVLAQGGPWTLEQLQRQLAYDRLLQRLYRIDEGWIIKGATALLARGIGVRGTLDIDVYRPTSPSEAEATLRAAASMDIGDWFTFELGTGSTVATDAAIRIPVDSLIGSASWVKFHVDLVGSDVRMTGQPDQVPPLARIAMADVEQHGYRAYPLVDHTADKVTAIIQRYGELGRPSTRFKDLVDLVAIATQVWVLAEDLAVALDSEARRREVELPGTFDVPDRELWERGFAQEARRSHLATARTLGEALEIVRRFVDPVLRGSAAGEWDPIEQRWR